MTLSVAIRKTLVTRERRFTLDVSFETACSRVVLFGPSGAGKTLTLQAIAGLLPPDYPVPVNAVSSVAPADDSFSLYQGAPADSAAVAT